MTLKKTVRLLHLWLGLVSGIIVTIVCLTGAIWALNIHGWVGAGKQYSPESRGRSLLPPSVLAGLSEDTLNGRMPSYISYARDEPSTLGVYGRGPRITLTVDPYTGEMYGYSEFSRNPQSRQKFNFWHFIRRGHQSLWLPMTIGRPVVNYATMGFVIVLVSGIFLWYPRSGKAFKARIWFRWKKGMGLKRKILDLHIISGFYVSLILVAVALTGMVWGIKWYSDGLYRITSGKELPEWGIEESDTTAASHCLDPMEATDRIFGLMQEEYPDAASIFINFPDTTNALSTIRATVYPEKGKYYNRDCFVFDRYTLKEIKAEGPYNGRYSDAGFADRLRRMNYDIHIGSVLGLPGKILVFIAALIGAFLPVTGLYMYIRKNR